MKLNERDLALVIEEVINKGIEEMNLSETNFQIDNNDPNMQQKIKSIKDNSSIYDETKDNITVESLYTKSDILNIMKETKTKRKKQSSDDYMKAIKKADREIEYELDGPGWKAKNRPHKNKSKYDRKLMANDDLTESTFTKKDITNMILEKKYNGKVYSKAELMELLANSEKEQ